MCFRNIIIKIKNKKDTKTKPNYEKIDTSKIQCPSDGYMYFQDIKRK